MHQSLSSPQIIFGMNTAKMQLKWGLCQFFCRDSQCRHLCSGLLASPPAGRRAPSPSPGTEPFFRWAMKTIPLKALSFG